MTKLQRVFFTFVKSRNRTVNKPRDHDNNEKIEFNDIDVGI